MLLLPPPPPRALQAALQLVAQNMGAMAAMAGFRAYARRNPSDMERVLEQVHRNNQAKPQSIVADELNQDEFESKQQFPLVPLLLFLGFGYVYSNLSRTNPMLGNAIPYANAVLIIVVMIVAVAGVGAQSFGSVVAG